MEEMEEMEEHYDGEPFVGRISYIVNKMYPPDKYSLVYWQFRKLQKDEIYEWDGDAIRAFLLPYSEYWILRAVPVKPANNKET